MYWGGKRYEEEEGRKVPGSKYLVIKHGADYELRDNINKFLTTIIDSGSFFCIVLKICTNTYLNTYRNSF